MKNIMKRENGSVPATFGSVVDQLFQKNLSRFFDDSFWGADDQGNRGMAPVNIRETDKTYEMELAAPGLRKEQMQINTSGDTLTISYEHTEEQNSESRDGWVRQEFRQRSFNRSFNLDDSIDAARITARYENGVLYLTLPKKEHAQKVARTIEVV